MGGYVTYGTPSYTSVAGTNLVAKQNFINAINTALNNFSSLPNGTNTITTYSVGLLNSSNSCTSGYNFRINKQSATQFNFVASGGTQWHYPVTYLHTSILLEPTFTSTIPQEKSC